MDQVKAELSLANAQQLINVRSPPWTRALGCLPSLRLSVVGISPASRPVAGGHDLHTYRLLTILVFCLELQTMNEKVGRIS